MAITLRRSRPRSFSPSPLKNKQPKLASPSPISVSSSTTDDSSNRSARLSVGGIANMFIKLRHLERRSKASKASNTITCSSGIQPLTHPHSRLNAEREPKYISRHADTYVCAGNGGVDAVLLLRATRSVLVQEASRIGATLAQERWSYVISEPKQRPKGQYKVYVQYEAALVKTDCQEILHPVAIDKIQRIPGLMTVISRNSE